MGGVTQVAESQVGRDTQVTESQVGGDTQVNESQVGGVKDWEWNYGSESIHQDVLSSSFKVCY